MDDVKHDEGERPFTTQFCATTLTKAPFALAKGLILLILVVVGVLTLAARKTTELWGLTPEFFKVVASLAQEGKQTCERAVTWAVQEDAALENPTTHTTTDKRRLSNPQRHSMAQSSEEASNEQNQFRLGVPTGDFNGDTLYTFRSNSVASSHSEDHEELPLLQPSSPPLAEKPTTPSPPSPPLVILTLTTSLSQLEIPDDVDSVQALTPRSGQTDGSPAEPLSPQPSDSVSPRLSTSLSPLALVDNLVRLPTPPPVVIMAESAYRSVFPAPVKYGLPGLFVGDNITDFLEAYEEACRDLRVTADDDKADRFGRWCERDIRKVIQRFDAADLATWTTLKAKIKKRWAIRDPDQKGDYRALDKLFNKPYDTSAESIF